MRRTALVAILTVAIAASLGLAACGKKQAAAPTPKIAPPAISEAANLKVGVDFAYPPFAGQDKGQQVGIDVDVASALAEKLGLKLILVDVKPSDAATALADGTADIVMSVPLSQTSDGKIGYAGSYITDGPVFFSKVASGSVEPSISINSLGTDTVAAQYGSDAFWYLQDQLGEQYVKGFSTLAEPLQKLAEGSVKLVAGDAVVGSYIARDLEDVRVVGQLKPAGLVGIGVRADNAELQTAVRSTLDALTADGVLKTIRKKWVADLSELTLPASTETTTKP